MNTQPFDDLSSIPGAFRAKKLPVPVEVVFAEAAGSLATREGWVAFQAGDALLTGIERERWPVQRNRFLQTYQALPPMNDGDPGRYVKRPLVVWCLRADADTTVQLIGDRGQLHAMAGDIIVQYQPGDLAVVSASIFRGSYQVCET